MMGGCLYRRVDIRPCVISVARGFTLVELMVVLVIIAMLASLTLAGLSGVRQRAKEDKTRNTIRKIDSVIQPMYESYATRRVTAAGATRTAKATSRLQNIHLLMAVEMPDMWGDVGTALPAAVWAQNAVYRRYTGYKVGNATRTDLFGPAETLMMILMMGGFEPGSMEQFRSDEIGDIDGDGAKEFLDGWGRPVMFIRWPAGFTSPFIDTSQPDPLDVMRVTGDWAMVPLIYSAGPDEALNDPLGALNGYGLSSGTVRLPGPINSTCVGNTSGSAITPLAVTDTITNYDLLKK